MDIKLTDEEILDLLENDLDRASDIQEERADLRDSAYKAFRGDAYGNEREGWSQSVAKIIWTNHQSNLGSLVDIFSNDFFILKSDNYDKSSRIQKQIRTQMFVKQDGYRHLYDFMFDAGLYEFGIFKVYHKEDFDLVDEKYDRLTLPELEALLQSGEVQVTKYTESEIPSDGFNPPQTILENVKVVRKVIKYKGAAWECLPPWAFGYSPDCKRSDWGGIEGRLVYHQFKLSLNDIRKRERAKIYKDGTYNQCLELGEDSTDKSSEQISIEYDSDGLSPEVTDSTVERDESDLNRELNVKECYCKLDLDGDGLQEAAMVVLIEDEVIAQVQENPYKRPPFRIGGLLPEPHKVNGILPPSILETDQKVMTNLLRFIQDQAAMSTYRNIVTNDTRMQSMLQTRKPFDIILGDPDKLGEVPVQTGDGFILKAWELLKGENEETTGSSRYNQGTDGSSLNKTATGVQLITQNSAKRLRMSAKAIATSALTGVVKDFIFINRKWKTEQPQPILGTDISIQPQDWDSEFDIEIDIGVSAAEKQLLVQQYDFFAQFATQAGIPMGLMNPQHLAKIQKRKYNLFNINIDELMYTDQQFMQETQKREQNKPKEDWREFVAIDKMFPLLARSEQAQILQKLEIQPDPQAQVAGIPQARDILAAQSKAQDTQAKSNVLQQSAQIKAAEAMQKMKQEEQKHNMDMQGKVVDLNVKREGAKIDLISKVMKGQNDQRRSEHTDNQRT
jgi:hypothetical protein